MAVDNNLCLKGYKDDITRKRYIKRRKSYS